MTTFPDEGAIQFHQTDFPPASPPWFDSPACLVSFTFVPAAEMEEPVRVVAEAKLSLGGGAMLTAVASQSEALMTSCASLMLSPLQALKSVLPDAPVPSSI